MSLGEARKEERTSTKKALSAHEQDGSERAACMTWQAYSLVAAQELGRHRQVLPREA